MVKFRDWNEELLPEESVEDLHDHSKEFLGNVIFLGSSELDILNSHLQLR